MDQRTNAEQTMAPFSSPGIGIIPSYAPRESLIQDSLQGPKHVGSLAPADGPSGHADIGTERPDARMADGPYPAVFSVSDPGAASANEDAYHHHRVGDDISLPHQQQTPRSLLAVQTENGRRGGRNSPLPQAVQGAQGQLSGPAGEPGIRSEFGRMFSGIGSGVGSALASTGPGTNGDGPQMLQELPQKNDAVDDHLDATTVAEATDTGVAPEPSRGTKRPRKSKLDKNTLEVEGSKKRASPEVGLPKKLRPVSHHHHHYPIGPQYVQPRKDPSISLNKN